MIRRYFHFINSRTARTARNHELYQQSCAIASVFSIPLLIQSSSPNVIDPTNRINASQYRSVTTGVNFRFCSSRGVLLIPSNGCFATAMSTATSYRARGCRWYTSFHVASTPIVKRGDSLCRPSVRENIMHLNAKIDIRTFKTVGEYHSIADETLHSIQDAVEDYLEEYYDVDEDEEDIPEVNYASGVMSIYLPPHGTWIINKQTPNQQLWWSSPISGPRRYEYDEKSGRWIYSRVLDERGGADDSGGVPYGEEDTLGGVLNKEFEELFGQSLGLDSESQC